MSVVAPPPSSGLQLAPAARLTVVGGALRAAPDAGFGLALGALLAALTFKAGGGLSLGPTTVVELVLEALGSAVGVVAILASGAATQSGARRRAGLPALALLALLAAFTALSILWAVDPDAAWLESSRTLAYLATFAAGIALVQLAPNRWNGLLSAVVVCCTVVSAYALLTKVFPAALARDETYARLREPFGYWNAVGVMGALGLPGCLWLGARRGGHAALTALAYPAGGIAILTVLEAYSRGSLLAAACGCAFWFAFVPLRLRGAAVVGISALGAVPVALWAFGLHGLSTDNASLDMRSTAGHELGVALVFMLLLLYAAGLAVGFALANTAPDLRTRRRAGTVLVVALALVPVAALGALSLSSRGLGGSLSHGWTELTDPNASIGTGATNQPGRLTAVGSARARYYSQALKVFRAHKLLGSGAGTYGTARLTVRTDDLDVQHAHSYVFQTLSDLGLIGFALSLALLAAWLAAAWRAVGGGLRGADRPGFFDKPFGPERVGLLSLCAVVIVFGVHSLVDWTWFVPGPTIVALLCAAWVAGRGGRATWSAWLGDGAVGEPKAPLRARLSRGLADHERAVLAVTVAVIALATMWSTWQPLRAVHASDAAFTAVDRNDEAAALRQAARAHRIDPLSIQPLFDLSVIRQRAGDGAGARRALLDAARLQPRNPMVWSRLADEDLNVFHDPAAAKRALGPAFYLDPRSSTNVTLFLDASRLQASP